MSELPSMPLYVDDYEAATAHLTLEEDGAYNRLLRLCWRDKDCSIPNDDSWIARKMRIDQATFDRLVAPLIDEFFTVKKARIFQKKQREIHASVRARVEARRDAGSKGGKARALKNKEKASGKTKDLPQAKAALCSSIQSQNQIQSQKAPTGVAAKDAAPPLDKTNFQALGELACLIAGIDPAMVAVSFQAPIGWIAAGFDSDLDVAPAIRSIVARPGYKPPNNLKYFTACIRDFNEKRLAGMPTEVQKAARATQPVKRRKISVRLAREDDFNGIWKNAETEIADELGTATFNSWIAPLSLRRRGDLAVFIAPTRFHRDWILSEYWDRIRFWWQHHGGQGMDIEVGLVEDRGAA